jgi:Ankyrin repeat
LNKSNALILDHYRRPFHRLRVCTRTAKNSTALHVAAWRAWPAAVKELIAHGAVVDALDGKGRNALSLAIKACVDSYWTRRRSPESTAALLAAGASVQGIELPTGYDEIDALLRRYRE